VWLVFGWVPGVFLVFVYLVVFWFVFWVFVFFWFGVGRWRFYWSRLLCLVGGGVFVVVGGFLGLLYLGGGTFFWVAGGGFSGFGWSPVGGGVVSFLLGGFVCCLGGFGGFEFFWFLLH